MKHLNFSLTCLSSLLLAMVVFDTRHSQAAQFDGTGRVDVVDSTGALSGNPSASALTVECWFKLSVPSTVTLTKNMVILSNLRASAATDLSAYIIQYNILTGNVEFGARGTNGALPVQTLVSRPYLERWYHVAVTRSGSVFTGYADGRQQFSVGNDLGSSANTTGVFIGGTPDDSANLYGEVQEVAIYQTALTQSTIIDYMFQSQPALTQPALKGYFTLGSPSVTGLMNSALNPPAGTGTAVKNGNVTFDITNLAGEQSAFDLHKNGGRDAFAPLAGGYSWTKALFRRNTPGIPFEFKIGYNSSQAHNGVQIPLFPAFDTNGLGAGWSHTFDIRIVPADTFQPAGTATTIGLLMWDGSLDVWDFDDNAGVFKPRSGEYRGDLTFTGSIFSSSSKMTWTTPERVQYVFNTPYAGTSATRGRLSKINDFNATANVVNLSWDSLGFLQTVTDSAGGTLWFKYDAQNRLSYVGYLGTDVASPLWKVSFTYNAQNRLATFALTGPAAYAAVPATWGFFYKSSADNTNGLIEKIADPRGYNGGTPSYYTVQLAYDTYGRVISQKDGLLREQVTKYNVPATRQISRADAYQSTQATPKYWVESYDRKSHVTDRTDPLGNKSTFEFDAAGNTTASVDANSNRTEFTYDSRSNVLSKRNVTLNQTTAWEYNATLGSGANLFPLNKPTRQTDPPAVHSGASPASWVTNFAYDSGGNLLRQYDAMGDVSTSTYFASGLLNTAKDARGFTSSFTYTAEGFLATKTVPDVGGASRTWNYTCTELGWLKTEQNPVQPQSQFFQDINGSTSKVIDSFGRTFLKNYDANGNLLTDTDAKGQQTVYTYDNANQRITMQQRDHTAGAPRIWNYGYTLRGESSFIRDPSLSSPANSLSYEYDDAGRRTKETDANGFFSTTIYDAVGNVRFVTDKEGKQSEQRYDSLNRVITSIDPEGDTTTTTYDNAGRLDTITNPKGSITRHAYDGRSRLIKWTDPEGSAWQYAYDENANILDVLDANGGHYLMTYGPRGERLTEKNQDLKTWTYAYDELLRLKTQTDPEAVSRSIAYDDAGRVDTISFSTGRSTIFFYDDNNNPTEIRRIVSGVTTKTTLTYDAMDRVLSAKDTFNKTVGYTYDAASRLSTTVYPGGQPLTRGYDPAGRLSTLTDWSGRASTFTYDKVGRLKSHAYPNGITTALSYDNAGRITALNQGPAASPSQVALTYAYDRNGNKSSEQKKGVLDWQPGSGAGQVAEFDETYTPTAAGRLVSSSDSKNASRNTTYVYGESGNMTSATSAAVSTTFSYDEDNRVTQLTYTTPPLATQTVVNRYDALGRRISRSLTNGGSTTETRYILDLTGGMERILADTDVSSSITARYVHGPDGLGYKENAATGAITCFHSDAMGNILRLTDATGAAIADYTYSPYGRLLATTGSAANPYRFVGSQGVMEEFPNLYFMRARYYSADAGVFLSTDPVKNIGPGWKSVAYAYAEGNPLRYSDPQGRMSQETADKIARYNAESLQYSIASANADAWVSILEATSAALDTSLALVTGDATGVAAGLSKQIAGLATALGYDDAGKVIGITADTVALVDSIRTFDLDDVLKGSSALKGQVTRRGLAGVADLSSSTKTAATAADLFGKGVSGLVKAAESYFNPVSFSGSSSSGSTNNSASAANYASGTNQVQTAKLAPVTTVTKTTTATGGGGGGGGASSSGSSNSGKTGSTGGSSSTYTVKAGDTLGNIGASHGTTATKLGALNGISDLNRIYPGQVLKLQ